MGLPWAAVLAVPPRVRARPPTALGPHGLAEAAAARRRQGWGQQEWQHKRQWQRSGQAARLLLRRKSEAGGRHGHLTHCHRQALCPSDA